MQPQTAVILDLDGTLVDSVYVHVVAWQAAFRAAGHTVAATRIHAAIGMGSDRLIPWLIGHVDDADSISDDHGERFLASADELSATTGAKALVEDLEVRSVPFIIATSANDREREVLLRALGREDLPIVGADDVASSKPAPDLLLAACEELGVSATDAVMVGDAPWDARAARRAGMDAIGLRCGGFHDATLRDAGAVRVVDAPIDLVGTL